MDRLYFRQLLAGRDVAVGDPVATSMANFMYLVGDRDTGECLVVDPCYAVQDLLDTAAADGMRVVGALASHYHADHVGGSMMGYELVGVRDLLELLPAPIPVHVQRAEVPWVTRTTGLGEGDLAARDPGDTVSVGTVTIECLHTPGHTPGSQCFLVDGRLVAGDTLFLDGCGRTDLPGSDPEQMYDSLSRLAALPDDLIVFPGHRYSLASSATMAAVREQNYVFKPKTKQAWLAMFASG